jgi:hypothetical protein
MTTVGILLHSDRVLEQLSHTCTFECTLKTGATPSPFWNSSMNVTNSANAIPWRWSSLSFLIAAFVKAFAVINWPHYSAIRVRHIKVIGYRLMNNS